MSPVTPRPVNVATPATAATVAVPASVPPPLAIATVTEAVDATMGLPAASRTSTTGCVVIAAAEAAPAGCVLRPSCDAAPGETVTVTPTDDTLPLEAVIVALPTSFAVTIPPVTEATASFDEAQAIPAVPSD
jgi:hypothetical protein